MTSTELLYSDPLAAASAAAQELLSALELHLTM
jgi:hypothetical protein